MDTQILSIILIGFGALTIILFGLDIYYLAKRSKKGKEEKGVVSFNFSERFLLGLEEMINQEVKKAISEINQKIAGETIESYKKQTAVFSQEAENKMADWDEIIKKEILKFSNTCSGAEDLILQEAKSKVNELNKGLDEKIDLIYEAVKGLISEKIVQTEKNIEDYKKERIKELDEKIYLILGETAKKTLGKIIDLSTHEELVVQALEKAKKEKIL
jgi:hypothetical protein